MITIQDLYNIVGNKIANEAQKALIRNNFPPQIAEQMCNAIDGQERAEHFQRLLKEYNEWMQNQQRQQEAVSKNNMEKEIRTAFQDAIEKWCPNEDIWIKRASTISCLQMKNVN